MLDGVYRTTESVPEFHAVRAYSAQLRTLLLGRIIKRRMRFLTRKGYLIREQGMTTLADADPDLALGPCKRRPAPTASPSGRAPGKKY